MLQWRRYSAGYSTGRFHYDCKLHHWNSVLISNFYFKFICATAACQLKHTYEKRCTYCKLARNLEYNECNFEVLVAVKIISWVALKKKEKEIYRLYHFLNCNRPLKIFISGISGISVLEERNAGSMFLFLVIYVFLQGLVLWRVHMYEKKESQVFATKASSLNALFEISWVLICAFDLE